MPSLSKIPQSVNKYAIECAYKIRNKKVEFAKGIDFNIDKITAESKFIKGKKTAVKYNFATKPKDVFIHNHPSAIVGADELSFNDIGAAIKSDVKKIFASTPEGYTSLDLTTVKKNIPKERMLQWILGIKVAWEIKQLLPRSVEEKKIMHYNNIKKFAKFSGATFSDVKWSDYPQLKGIMQDKAQKQFKTRGLKSFFMKFLDKFNQGRKP